MKPRSMRVVRIRRITDPYRNLTYVTRIAIMAGLAATVFVLLLLGPLHSVATAQEAVLEEAPGAKDQPAPTPGIAVLASSIGNDYPVEALADFIQKTRFSPVVVDWAWITYHWPRTNFSEVNKLVEILLKRKVEVAAMYRPRFLGQATVPIQVKRDGTPVMSHGREICFSSEEARRWGLAWGEKILEKCPAFDEIIIYNPRNLCQCPKCLEAQNADSFAHHVAVWKFLSEARTTWRARRPGMKLGVVYLPDKEFWTRGQDIVDAARPFLLVKEDVEIEKNMAEVRAVRKLLKEKVKACLAKITWGKDDKVSPDKLAAFNALAYRNGIPYFFWTFDTLFLSELYDTRAVSQVLGLDYALVVEPLLRTLAARKSKDQQLRMRYTAEDIQKTNVETFFDRLSRAETGYHRFSAMWALIQKAKSGDAATADQVVNRAVGIIQDRTHPLNQRWQCCYVLSGIGDERGVPVLTQALLEDEEEVVRSVAACALMRFHTPKVRTALEQAEKQETRARVLNWVRKALSKGGGELKTQIGPISLADALSGKSISLVLVKDFLRMENSGTALEDVEFERYFPAVDAEQIVFARSIDARSDAREAIPVSITKVVSDVEDNFIHTYRLSRFPEKQHMLVTVTSLVARRERPAPKGEFPIPAPDEYPPGVRQFLSATAMVSKDHPEIRRQADKILAETRDAYQVAKRLAALMRKKSYLPTKKREPDLPTAVSVLRYGGSCCGSAVCAAAVLRACGIPTQITYSPAGYIHGIVRFYLKGHGWVRMDATSGVGKLPFVQSERQLGYVRIFDMPVEMEAISYAYAWPYYHNDLRGKYQFRAEGRVCDTVRFAHKGKPGSDGVQGRVAEPFPHLESGSWNPVLGSVPNEGAWEEWDALVQVSRTAVMSGATGEFNAVTAKLPDLAKYIAFGRDSGKQKSDD